MSYKLFGFTLLTPREVWESNTKLSIVTPPNDDAAATVAEGGTGAFGAYRVPFSDYVDYGNDVDLINQYRNLALQPEIDEALNDIIHELIVRDKDEEPVTIDLDDLPEATYDDAFRQQVEEEFEYVLHLLDFNNRCYDIARQFYVDGRLFYDLILDEKNPEKGIVEVRNIDPRTIKPVREVRERIHQETGVRVVDVTSEYFLFNPDGISNMSGAATNLGINTQGTRIAKDRVAYVNSGIYTPGNVTVLSHLHKAIKPFNQLRMVEDATVIYRITRAPERRVFYIDVADLPTAKAEAYLQQTATRYRNRVVYDSNTGAIRDDRKVQSMLEDFFLPRRGNTGKGTEVTTLEGGQNLGEMTDVEYFKKKLYRSLNLPLSRLENDGGAFQVGKATEIARDEIKFGRFLVRLRDRLAMIFDSILERHLTLKGIVRSPRQWQELRRDVKYNFVTDSHFNELKDMEVLNAKLTVLGTLDPYIGRFWSEKWVKDNLLHQSIEEQERIKQENLEEPPPPKDPMMGGGMGMGGPPMGGMDDSFGAPDPALVGDEAPPYQKPADPASQAFLDGSRGKAPDFTGKSKN